MTQQFLPSRRRLACTMLSVTALVAAGLVGSTSYAAGPGAGSPRASSTTAAVGATRGEQRSFYDARSQTPLARAHTLRSSAVSAGQPAVTSSRTALPGQTVLDLDATTGTVRMLTRLDGYLTGASHRGAPRIAHHYVARHHALLGLTTADLKTFHLKRNYVDISGTHHLYWTQRIGGQPVISNGLTAAVNKRGHLLTVGGSPISRSRAGKLPTGTLRLPTAADALAAARTAGQVPAGADLADDTAARGLFLTPSGLHVAWRTVALSSRRPAERVVDAITGQLLLQHPLTNYEHSNDSTGRVFRFFPKSKRGGRQVKVDFTRHGWLSRKATELKGNNSHAYSDVNDDNRPEKSEEVKAQSGHAWSYLLKPFHPSLPGAHTFCSNPWPCSWDPDVRRSWQTNRAQNATQVFYFVNNWHDHLKRAPIGFTNAAGNFQAKNGGTQGKGGDAVATETDDGANTAGGLPDSFHIDNANMSTPPDGHAPTMQMYLQHQPGTSYPGGDPFSPTNVGDEADTVYHEYTHGLSNRLDVDVQGFSTLGNVQAGAMGEAWSDWYAMDYLVKQHLQKDRPGKVDVRLFRYDGVGVNFDRTEPIDCPVGSTAHLCNGADTGHKGGYTYADYGKVAGGPEVHSDGEIWAQTLWSLRHKLGSRKTEALVTRAMELAPYNPSFLDMRDAILVADTSLFKGVGRANIWRVFSKRGMGFFAGSLGGNDSAPGASFAMPPKHVALSTVQGTVTDGDTHAPMKGVPVTLAFQGKGAANPTAVTDANGHYAIHGVPVGHYRKLEVGGGGGFEPTRVAVTVGAAGATQDFAVRRDWAAASGGATVASFTGANYSSFGCGPDGAIDLSQATGWGSNAGPGTNDNPTGTFHAKQIVIDLHHVVDVTGFGVDPQSTCGDAPSASTSSYRIETSPDDTASSVWTVQHEGVFTSADNGRINPVPADGSPTGVQFVRFTIEANQVPDFATNCPSGGFDGCQFADLTELEVFGTPSP
jgi:extracellular elastinolytic metalloproteinase